MNTCARMESTCEPGRIQLSSDTAGLLVAAGKGYWLTQRETVTFAKGKGQMQTYWLDMRKGRSSRADSESDPSGDRFASSIAESLETVVVSGTISEKRERLVRWTADVLGKLLKKVVARRQAEIQHNGSTVYPSAHDLKYSSHPGNTVMDEVAKVIALPKFNAAVSAKEMNPETIVLGVAVEEQLLSYVRNIAFMYRDNPFHNFEHACRVLMSVNKLLSRIVAPSGVVDDKDSNKRLSKQQGGDKDLDRFMNSIAHDMIGGFVQDNKTKVTVRRKKLHDHTYGITSDPLTQFACVFSALIHDADHTGVPNTQLCKEQPVLAAAYKEKSVAEQVSVDLGK